MDRFLLLFGILIFAFCLIFFGMNFFVEDFDGMTFLWTLFGMLNASIAIGVSEILREVRAEKMERN